MDRFDWALHCFLLTVHLSANLRHSLRHELTTEFFTLHRNLNTFVSSFCKIEKTKNIGVNCQNAPSDQKIFRRLSSENYLSMTSEANNNQIVSSLLNALSSSQAEEQLRLRAAAGAPTAALVAQLARQQQFSSQSATDATQTLRATLARNAALLAMASSQQPSSYLAHGRGTGLSDLDALLLQQAQCTTTSTTCPSAAAALGHPSILSLLNQATSVMNNAATSSLLDASAHPSVTSSSHQASPPKKVRPEQIEAALRSKPQRGRRRDELNELERRELNRTRNREHAKTTRIRKKARYEELVEQERQLHALERRQTLQTQRRQAVLQYLQVREAMVTAEATGQEPPFVKTSVAPSSPKSDDGDDSRAGEVAVSLEDVVEDVQSFSYQIGPARAMGKDAKALHRMRLYDQGLVAGIEERFGKSSEAKVRFSIPFGAQGISLDEQDGGMAHVKVVYDCTAVAEGFLRFGFAAPESSKLSMVHWWQTQDNLELPRGDDAHNHISVSSVSVAGSDDSHEETKL